jgi:hypothetical protein
MWRKVLLAGVAVLTLAALGFCGILVSIRSGLQRFSDEATTRFPGGRVDALIQVVDCSFCPMQDRNHAVWALGQMVEERAMPVLRKHFDGQPCTHGSRLCQYELGKAIRMIETRKERSGPFYRMIAKLHQPWH